MFHATGNPSTNFQMFAVFAERAGGANLVEPHEARVASHIGGHYCCQPASNPNWVLLLHPEHGPLRETTPAPTRPMIASLGRVGPSRQLAPEGCPRL
jgi:hypothetical protein